ncbi:glycerophosphodiester phosphodiesterase [Guptibacillus algicola]|uniref:glycerophosphodiester phosphodiesterase n=1 Tax=Guptibacillus algicola TaxID=225844 RepID=UPI001CD53537|nr:glycerophosphodiester phosphodiesterase family protein [Alkalihalobacillus algicola]MCA0988442.1 glycerophosphodiester phosphodiesterase [Alkalihalobacillus algicola]
MKKIVTGTLIAMLAFGLILKPTGNAFAKKDDKILNVAHRGASGYAPENTMAAFEKAVDMKADLFELDVQLSKDGEVVVIHDTSVDRTTNGTGKVKEHTLEELRSLDAGSWFDESFTGERIPTLGEVLDQYRGKIGILIEIKSPSLYPGIEQKVADELKERNMHKPTNNKIIVQSFDHDSVQTFHNILPSVPVGVLVYNPTHLTDISLKEFSRYAEYVNPGKSLVDEEVVDRIHDYDMDIHPWTARDRESVEALKEAGVDGIITDYPDYM